MGSEMCIRDRLKSIANNTSNLKSNVITNYESLCLNLQLKTGDLVLVTNSVTKEQKEVTLGFLRRITRDSFSVLVQYHEYDLVINAKKYWKLILLFDPKLERNKEIELDRKLRKIMVSDDWMKISEHDKQMYFKALGWADSYNSDQRTIRKGAVLCSGAGAATGVLVGNTIGAVSYTHLTLPTIYSV